MENLELQEKVINLGKLFVKELKLEPGVDTFSRWMAHYLAEKISVAEQSEGDEKEAAEKECFEVILKLWAHRHYLPSGRRPLQSFQPILDLLSELNPDTEEPYFYKAFRNQDLIELKVENLDYKSVEEWISFIKEIDKTAKIWIEYALGQAVENAKNERTRAWIENAIIFSDNADIGVIKFLLDKNPLFDLEDHNKDDFSKQLDIDVLKKRISQLKKYSLVNETLLKAYEAKLKNFL